MNNMQTQTVNQFHQKKNSCEKLTSNSNKQIDELKKINSNLEIENGNLLTEMKELKLELCLNYNIECN